jgi:hypothetical protein
VVFEQKLSELGEKDADLGNAELEAMLLKEPNEAIVVCLDVSCSMDGTSGFRDRKDEEVFGVVVLRAVKGAFHSQTIAMCTSLRVGDRRFHRTSGRRF